MLRFEDKEFVLDAASRRATMGREEGCEIVIPGFRASRVHARVEYRSGKFVLIDNSSNGTYIRFRDGHVIRLMHEETVLHGSGEISLGQSFDEPPMMFLVGFSTE